MNALRLYGCYVGASLRAQAQYPAATLLLTAGHVAATAIEILGVFALFHRFGQVKGWSFGEVALFYGLINITFSIADLLTRGFDVFGTDFVRTGAFDRVLLRARSATLQLIGYEIRLSRFGRMLQGLAVLALATSSPISIGTQLRSRPPFGRWLAGWLCSPESWYCRRHSLSGPSRAWKSSMY